MTIKLASDMDERIVSLGASGVPWGAVGWAVGASKQPVRVRGVNILGLTGDMPDSQGICHQPPPLQPSARRQHGEVEAVCKLGEIGTIVRNESVGLSVDLRNVLTGESGRARIARDGFYPLTQHPVAGGGARVDCLSPEDVTRIQNAADRTRIRITVVGSRATGTAGPMSDYDYVLSGSSAQARHGLRGSLPAGPSGLGEPRNQDFHPEPVDETRPYITFTPRGS
jgi:hypothetical protein